MSSKKKKNIDSEEEKYLKRKKEFKEFLKTIPKWKRRFVGDEDSMIKIPKK